MASSGQAFNSLSYGMEGMELSSNLLPLPSCLLWVPILGYASGKERLEPGTRWFAAMDGEVEHVQQQKACFAAQVASQKCKNVVSVSPVLLWPR